MGAPQTLGPRVGSALTLQSAARRERVKHDSNGGPSTYLWAGGPTNRPPESDDPVACGLFVLPPGEGVELR